MFPKTANWAGVVQCTARLEPSLHIGCTAGVAEVARWHSADSHSRRRTPRMHGIEGLSSSPADDSSNFGPWYKELTRYHWFVLIVAALGWLFDTMDQQLFVLSRVDA